MSRHGLALAMATLLATVTVASCAAQIEGTATPQATVPTDSHNAADPSEKPATTEPPESADPDRVSDTVVADPGECVNGNEPTPVDCEEPHTVEITASGTFGGALADGPPNRDEIFETVFPSCREEAARYLGSDEYDLTTLSAWLLWAGEDAWARGERWYRCGVAELDDTNEAKQRTGSVRGALKGDGVHEYRFCSLPAPSKQPPVPTPCDQPHRAEAVAVVSMGEPTDPLPSEEEFVAAATRECEKAVVEYRGTKRRDVSVTWRWPDEVAWKRGFNNFTCYAQTDEPITGTLRDIEADPLPQ